jgi:hypothetical protein
MGRQKKGNANAQRNNNVKENGADNQTEFASYAEMEVQKMHHGKKTK